MEVYHKALLVLSLKVPWELYTGVYLSFLVNQSAGSVKVTSPDVNLQAKQLIDSNSTPNSDQPAGLVNL